MRTDSFWNIYFFLSLDQAKNKKLFYIYMLYSLHDRIILLHKYMSTEHWLEFTRVIQTHVTIRCDTICVVDNSRYPTGLSAHYCLIQFTCILFLLLEYICFSIYLFVFPVSFFCLHHNNIYLSPLSSSIGCLTRRLGFNPRLRKTKDSKNGTWCLLA